MLNQEEKNNLKRPITKEFEVKIKILLREKKKAQAQWDSQQNYTRLSQIYN